MSSIRKVYEQLFGSNDQRAIPSQDLPPPEVPAGLHGQEASQLEMHAQEHKPRASKPTFISKFKPSRKTAVNELRKMVAEMKQKASVPVPPFHLNDGRELTSTQDLADACLDMSEETFSHHVNAERNDFATWIADGVRKPMLAQRVRAVHSAQELHDVLRKPVGPPLTARESALQEEVTRLKEEKEASPLHTRPEPAPAPVTLNLDEVKKVQAQLEQEKEALVTQKPVEATPVKEAPAPESETPATPTPTREQVLSLVHSARNLIEVGQIEEAKDTYTQARKAFYDAEDISEDEEHELYNLIRELYTDIELAKLY